MKRPPYSLAEAQKLAASYQQLVGQTYSRDTNAIIECVTVAPFDKLSKERFLIFYFLFNSAESALSQEYEGLLFDVLVIARSQDDPHELLQEDLLIWLADDGLIHVPEKNGAAYSGN
jgi:cellulose synthase/poly-beta-1,6-N-acetylglucosamine synthase-like glycosyltransferase